MALQVETAFVHDAGGRIVRTNERDAQPTPRLLVARTAAGDVVRFGYEAPLELVARLAGTLARERPVADFGAPLTVANELRAALDEHGPVTEERSGPAYRFPDGVRGSAGATEITTDNLALVAWTFPWLVDELADWAPCFAVVRDGAAVSVCFSSRNGPRAACAGVETLPDFRGRGYAPLATAAWEGAIRASGRVPFYSTTWDNLASQAVARKLGLVMFGAEWSWR
jgi:hypothetical protein